MLGVGACFMYVDTTPGLQDSRECRIAGERPHGGGCAWDARCWAWMDLVVVGEGAGRAVVDVPGGSTCLLSGLRCAGVWQ